jgi:transposase-like protein
VVANRPVYIAIGIDCDGARQVLGLWVGPTTGESAKFWLTVLSDVKARGVADVCILCCDGLTGLPDAVGAIWPAALVQLCVVHLIRASLRYASKKDWGPLTRDLRSIYTAVDEQAAQAARDAFADFPATHWKKIWSTDESVNRGRHGGVSLGCRPARRRCLGLAARSRGQGGAPGWRNDLDRGEDRGSLWRWWAWSTAERRAGCWDWKSCRAA